MSEYNAIYEAMDQLYKAKEGSEELDRLVAPRNMDEEIDWDSPTTLYEAAMSQIPEDWKGGRFQIGAAYREGIYKRPCGARFDHWASSGGGPYVEAFAETLPLAICICSLKIKIQEDKFRKHYESTHIAENRRP